MLICCSSGKAPVDVNGCSSPTGLYGLTLVYTGEHFVIDILMGWLYAAATFSLGSKLLDVGSRRALQQSVTADSGVFSWGVPS